MPSHPAPARLCVGGAGLTDRLLNPISSGLLPCDVGPPHPALSEALMGGGPTSLLPTLPSWLPKVLLLQSADYLSAQEACAGPQLQRT